MKTHSKEGQEACIDELTFFKLMIDFHASPSLGAARLS